jgi:hypothetical protein
MKITKLIAWLKKHKINLIEDTLQPEGCRVLIFTTDLPRMPFGEDRHVWATLVIEEGQEDVSESEIDSLLRHCWHGELEIPREDG